jgi:plastocyanin
MAEVIVIIEGFRFVPDAVSVSAGDTVRWTNNDSADHTSTSDGPGWDSGPIVPGTSFRHEFTSPGTFAYHCALHPSMTGTVTVG